MRYRFGRYELDEEAGELRHDGSPRPVQPKPFELLRILLRERERIVTQDELLEELWPETVVTPSSLTRAVSLARKAIGDSRRGELIRSVARRGYRFVGDVVEIGRAGRTGRAALPVRPGGPVLAEVPAAASDAPEAAGPSVSADESHPFVGRVEALEELSGAWGEAVAGRGSLVVVSGPPGIGKTRLAERFAGQVERAGGLVLSGRCREDVPAFWPWAQVLRQLVERGGDTSAFAELPGGAGELAEWVPDLSPPAAPSPESDPSVSPTPERRRFLLFDAVTRTLRRLSRRDPLLVLLEDVHWAGSTSLRLLEHLLFELGDAAILVVATVRDEPRPADHPVEQILPVLRQQTAFRELVLENLSRRQVGELLSQLLGRAAPADLTSELYACSEGVPLFLREAIRMLWQRGDLQHPERVRRWAVTLPSRALDLIRRPLGRLSSGTARLVGAAAVLGRDFTLQMAAAVADLPRDTALDGLDEAERAGVVEPLPESPGSWRFTHALFREAAVEALPAGSRARLHARAAAEIERRHAGDPERVLSELATHHHAALAVVDPERAYALAWRAAERSSAGLAHDQAATHLEQALAALDHFATDAPEERLRTLLSLGEAHGLARERERRRAVFDEANELARSLGRPVDQARAAIGFCDLSEWAPKDDQALQIVDEALACVPHDAIALRAGLLTRRAYLAMREHPDHSRELAREAVGTARASADDTALQDALYALFFILAGPDHCAERRELAEEAVAAARRSGAAEPSLIAMLDMACDRVMEGDMDEAIRWRETAAQIAGSDPQPTTRWHMWLLESGLALLRGDFAEGERLAAEAGRLGRRIAHPYARGVERALHMFAARERGRTDLVLQQVQPLLPVRAGPAHWVQAVVGRALAAADRGDEARRFYDDLMEEGPEQIPRNIRWNASVAEVAHLCADVRDAERADRLIGLLEPVALQHGIMPMPIFYAGPFTAALGRLHALRGELREAEDLLDDALGSVEALGARPAQARVLAWLGAVAGRRGERRRARSRLEQAGSLAKELGMRGVEEEARSALGALGT